MESATSIAVSVGTSFVLFCGLYATFRTLSRWRSLAVNFYPAKLLAGQPPPDYSWGSLGWLRDTWQTSEEDLVHFAGLDALVYLKMQLACACILGFASLYCLLVLLPLCATANGYEDLQILIVSTTGAYTSTYIEFDTLTLGNVPDGSSIFWVFAFGAYWVTAGTIFFLCRTYQNVMELRTRYLAHEKPPIDIYAILVRDISRPWFGPNKHKVIVDSEFSSRYGKAYEGAFLIPKLGKSLGAYNRLRSAKRKLQEAYNLWEWSKTPENPSGRRPTRLKNACCPWEGQTDRIEYYTQKVKDRVEALQKAQAESTVFSGTAFVFFNDPTVAAIAAKSIPGFNSALWTITQAPQPEDVEWESVTMSLWNRGLRRAIVWTITWVTVAFYFIPIGFVAGLTTLDNLVYLFPFLASVTNDYLLQTLLEAYLPQLALLLFLAFLPTILDFISWFEGIPSKSHKVRAAAGKYYYFIIINVFLGYTSLGGLLGILESLAKTGLTFDNVTNLLGSSLPKQSTFFITYIALKFLIFKGLELSGLVHIFNYNFKRIFFSRTEEGVRAAWFPGPLPYLWLVPNDLLVVTLGLCYCIVAPLILPFAFIYHVVSWIVYKHQALTYYVPEYDSRGRFWPHMHNRILFALLTSQLTIIGYLSLKDFLGTWFLIPLPIATVVYFQYSHTQFYPTYSSHWAPGVDVKPIPPSIDDLRDAYTPNCLRAADAKPAPLRRLSSLAVKIKHSEIQEAASSDV